MAGVDDTIAITLPAALVPSGGSNTLRLAIVKDKNGKRAISRRYLDANSGGIVSRRQRVEWEIWGPIGQSLQSTSPYLGIDFTRDMESRWERRLTSALAETTVTLTGFDPPGTGSYFGSAVFGSSYFGSPAGGGAGSSPPGVVFDEQSTYLFAHRGQLSTQIRLSDWTVIATEVQDAVVRWADHWYQYGRIALGPSVPMQTRTGVSTTGATYANTSSTSPSASVYANYIRRGSDRAWIVDAAQAGDEYNYAGFTLDGFVTMATPFQVGDPFVGVNGIGPLGPVTAFGSEDGIYSFTDQGKPVPLSKALDALHSEVNGQQFADPGWGWNYYLSVAGLRCHDLRGTDNPVGIGERMRGFTGHNGIPTAVFAARGELWVVYETSAGDVYGYRGTFGPETGGTGQPLFFPWFYAASQGCAAIFSSTTPNTGTQNVTIIRFADTNLTYMTIAANGRDDLASLTYSTGGGIAYLTTLDQNPNLLKTLRLARVRTRNLTSGSSFAVAFTFDANPNDPVNASYVTVGTVTTNGFSTLTPVTSGTPLTTVSGRTMKPRITQVAAGSGASTTPPEMMGTLEVEYDERPEQVEEITVAVNIESVGWTNNRVWQVLESLVGDTNGPVAIQMPDDLPPGVSSASGGGQLYVMFAGVTDRQDASAETEQVTLKLQVWPQASALSA